MSTIQVRSAGTAGLGLPRSAIRKERRRVRRAAGKRPLRRFLGVMTGGLTTIASARRVRESGQENIINRSDSAGLPDAPTDAAINLQAPDIGEQLTDNADAMLNDALASGADLDSTLRAAGITPDADTASNDIVDLRTSASGQSATSQLISQMPEGEVRECDCLVQQLAAGQGVPLTEAMWESAMTGCLQNRAGFRAAVSSLGQPVEACKPWYKRKKTWLIGAVAAGAYLVLSD